MTEQRDRLEWIDNKGDVWRVHMCECGEGCAVLMKWITREKHEPPKGSALARLDESLQALMKQSGYDEEWLRQEPDYQVTIPHDMLPDIIAGLQRVHEENKPEAEEDD